MKRLPAASRRTWQAAAVLLAVAVTGCGSAVAPVAAPGVPAVTSSLNTSAVTATGTWAVVVMGGSAADNNAFWQVFYRPAASPLWSLVTPPGVATNGGLVVAPGAGKGLLAGFRPGVDLTFSPLATTTDSGAHWNAGTSVLTAGLADVPDSLAQAANGTMLALTQSGTVQQAAVSATTWSTLATTRSVAATTAGRRCGLTALTGVSFASAGTLLAGACARPGVVGIFADQAGTWQSAAPTLPAALARQPATVLRLTRTPGGTAALLGVGASLLAAWSTDAGAHWTVSAPLHAGPAGLVSSAVTGGATLTVILDGGRAEAISMGGANWKQLPRVPAGTATLAAGPGNTLDALAASGSKLTFWRLNDVSAGAWTKAQVINVPIQYGSSGSSSSSG